MNCAVNSPTPGIMPITTPKLAAIPATLVLYESPRRVQRLLVELASVMGDERRVAVCRELTKRFEEVTRGTLAEVSEALDGRTLKGEVVLVIDRDRRALALCCPRQSIACAQRCTTCGAAGSFGPRCIGVVRAGEPRAGRAANLEGESS